MDDLKIDNWNDSYSRGENNILYPQVEVIKFLNRYIGKRISDKSTKNIIKSDDKLKCLDFACGLGIHAITAEEFGFTAYGVDISEVAIKKAKSLANSKGNNDLVNRFYVLNPKNKKLPFSDNFFDFSVAESCLDYMSFDNALANFKELKRVTKKYIYFSLVGASWNNDIAGQKLTKSEHQNGTFTCYFNKSLISELINCDIDELKQINKVIQTDEKSGEITHARYFIVYEIK